MDRQDRVVRAQRLALRDDFLRAPLDLLESGALAVARFALPQINLNIPQGKIASGIFLASLSLGIGILNAGCIA